MTLPAIILGIVIASLAGSVFHLWRGGGIGRLITYLALCQLGFWLGHWAGKQLGWNFWSVGPLHLGTAILGCLIVLGIGYWLSLVQNPGNETPVKKGIK